MFFGKKIQSYGFLIQNVNKSFLRKYISSPNAAVNVPTMHDSKNFKIFYLIRDIFIIFEKIKLEKV